MSHYETLGVAETASAAEIKTAYRRISMQSHPDRNRGDRVAEERFRAATAAYEVVGDGHKRRAYDAVRAPAPPASTQLSPLDAFRAEFQKREATDLALRRNAMKDYEATAHAEALRKVRIEAEAELQRFKRRAMFAKACMAFVWGLTFVVLYHTGSILMAGAALAGGFVAVALMGAALLAIFENNPAWD